VIEAVILFERYEQKDKSGKNACVRQERPNSKKNNFKLPEFIDITDHCHDLGMFFIRKFTS
jgi:hypothetical protein